MSVLKFTYQPSRSIDEVNKQVTELTEMLKSELLECATVSSMDELAFEVKQVDENGNQKFAQVNAAVGDTSAKVSMLATFNQAQGSITISAALKNGIEQSDIVLSGDHITLDGDVTITSGFKLSGDHITAHTITANEISSNYVYAGNIDAAQITTGKINADRIDASSISVQALINNYGNMITFGSGIKIPTSVGYARIYSSGLDFVDTSNYASADINTQGMAFAFSNGKAFQVSGNNFTVGMDASFLDDVSVSGNLSVTGDISASGDMTTSGRITANYCTLKSLSSSSGTDLVITSDGYVRKKSGSTKRVKNSISSKLTEEMDPHRLYKLPIVQFKYNTDYLTDKEDQRYDTPLIGFIAEDMELIYPQAVKLDGEKKPNGWDPYYIIPPMLALIQEQDKRIKRLEGKNGE